MTRCRAQVGLTLVEMLVVLTIMTLLFAAGVPAVKSLQNAFASTGSVEAMVRSALASARALAVRDQRYVGIRFQEDLEGHQYMIFVEHDYDETLLGPGVRAVEGMRAVKLPSRFCVLDLHVRTNAQDPEDSSDTPVSSEHLSGAQTDIVNLGVDASTANRDHNRDKYWVDMSTFTVMFSGSMGTVETRETRARNRQGAYLPMTIGDANDDVFNSPVNILDHDTGRFIQDDYADIGLGEELSRHNFVICDRELYASLSSAVERELYLSRLPRLYVNRHHGISVIP